MEGAWGGGRGVPGGAPAPFMQMKASKVQVNK